MAESVTLTHEGDVRVLTLDAPQRLNALNQEMLEEISAAITEVRTDPGARALVVTGAGRAFCAGADVTSLFGDMSRPTGQMRDRLREIYSHFLGLRDLTIPTVAAVNGVAIGAGINIALACDVVIAGPEARFAVTFAELGLHPGGGCTWFLAQRMGEGRALAAILESERIGAEEALRTGLVDLLVEDPRARALQLAGSAAAHDPALTRDIVQTTRATRGADLEDVVRLESWNQAASIGGVRFAAFVDDFRARQASRRS